jgi:hypothetical protein
MKDEPNPTEQRVLLSLIAFATLKASSISVTGPVAMGFSVEVVPATKDKEECINE